MGGCISCLTSPTCATFCGGLSTFAVIMLLMLGIAIKSEYRYVGKAWMGGDHVAGIPGLTHSQAAKNCFEVAAIYAVFLGLSVLCMLGNAAKNKIQGPRA